MNEVNPGDYFYANLGRPWELCKKHGFIRGGVSRWYHVTMGRLNIGDMVWVYYPKNPWEGRDSSGYIGLAQVTRPKTSVFDFTVDVDGEEVPIMDVDDAVEYRLSKRGGDDCEYFVGVDWLATVDPDRTFRKEGFYASRHTVCKPNPDNERWRRTVRGLFAHPPFWEQLERRGVVGGVGASGGRGVEIGGGAGELSPRAAAAAS